MDSIYDNIIFDYGIYDPQVRAAAVNGSDNTGNSIVISSELNTIKIQEEMVTEGINAELQTIKIQ